MRSLLIMGFVFTSCSVFAADLPTEKLNKSFAELSLEQLDGQPFSMKSLKEPKAVVVVFLSFDCPVSNSYADGLSKLADAYRSRGVTLLGVVPGEDSLASLDKLAKEYKLSFPMFRDAKLQAAQSLKATTMPEAFLLDHNLVLRYRGRIDNAYSARLKKNNSVTEHNLRDAIESVLKGEDIKTPVTKPIGCPIGPVERSSIAITPQTPTYHRDVLPILQQNCQSCHRPGQVGPFSLMTYKQTLNWAEDIVDYTKSRQMPPWKPVAGVDFSNARAMKAEEISTLAKWVEAGCPEGDPKQAPPPLNFTDEWQLGPPDLVLTVPEEYHVGPAGKDIFRVFVLPTGLTEDKQVIGYEVKPGNPRVVHHTLNFWDITGQGRKLEAQERARKQLADAQDKGPGYSVAMGIGFIPTADPERPNTPPTGAIGGWAPGQLATQLPEGAAFLLPKGADMLIQTHYHRTGKPEIDRLKIGLYFAKKPAEKLWQTAAVGGLSPLTVIPANNPDYKAKGSLWILQDATIHSVLPHMHLIGRNVKMTLTPPNGQEKKLIQIDEWDYNWQETYWLKEPYLAKAGTRFDIEATYDNSAKNPNNPFNPPRNIFFGEETTNEMLFGFIGMTPVGEGRVRFSRVDPALIPAKVKPKN